MVVIVARKLCTFRGGAPPVGSPRQARVLVEEQSLVAPVPVLAQQSSLEIARETVLAPVRGPNHYFVRRVFVADRELSEDDRFGEAPAVERVLDTEVVAHVSGQLMREKAARYVMPARRCIRNVAERIVGV